MTRHLLPGLRPAPLASYLAGLGLARLVGEQADPDVTVAWSDDGLVLETAVVDLATWLVGSYVPTPVLSPWNSGSGFGAKDVAPREALAALESTSSPRLATFRAAIRVAREVGERYRAGGSDNGDTNGAKERAVRELRNRGPEELLPWIDAAVVLGADRLLLAPLLGTGGNDGRLDFSTTFHQRLREVLDPASKARRRSAALANDLLAGTQQEPLDRQAVGQFDPAGAGGMSSSPFGAAGSLVNPWAFLLLIEGALLFAASAVRRQLHGARRAAIPFTVDASPYGSTSGADGETSRGEVWVPIWDQPFTLPEIRQLFAEARASWRGRPAQRAVEFYAATRTLGVARGVRSFTRYGFHQRNGLAYVAVPLDQVEVDERPAVRLVAELEDWVSWVRRGDSSTEVGRAVRRFDAAHLTFVRDGEARTLARLLAALTDLEQAVGRSRRARDSVPARRLPSAAPFLELFQEESSPELRVAVGLASCATVARERGSGRAGRTMRQLLLPLDPAGADRSAWRDTAVVPGLGARPLIAVLAEVLVWRCRTAAQEPPAQESRGRDGSGSGRLRFRGSPTFRYGVPVPATDLHAFARGQLDPGLLDLWLWACLALDWRPVRHRWGGPAAPGAAAAPVATLGLLHPLAAGLLPVGTEAGSVRIALDPDWALRLSAGQVTAVHAEAVRRLRQAGWWAVPPPAGPEVPGSAIAAALVPRCRTGPGRFALRLRTRDERQAFALETDNTEDMEDEDMEELS